MMSPKIPLLLLAIAFVAVCVQSFQMGITVTGRRLSSSLFSDATATGAAPLELKQDLLDLIAEDNALAIQTTIQQLEYFDSTGDVLGTWELLYCSTDDTRSSPFFAAFAQAYPENSDQIFDITDSIPAPLKDIGPATQEITENSLVSRVKVATLGGQATSIMTTRCSILQNSANKLTLSIESTKPEESTILEKLGPLGRFLNENLPPFPSGAVLERTAPGSSEVIQQNTYIDESLRISRYGNTSNNNYCVWKRTGFASLDF